MSYQQKVAVVLGNGTTRKEVDLSTIVGSAPIFGCNALYRDFKDWDYLVAIDDGMIEELKSQHFDGTLIIPPADERWEDPEYSLHRRRSNAGMNAMVEAIRRKHTILYCLGFDFILKGNVSTDNMYKNSQNYGPETHANQNDNYHRLKYLEWFASKHSDTKFVFVFPSSTEKHGINSDNVYFMDTQVFLNKVSH